MTAHTALFNPLPHTRNRATNKVEEVARAIVEAEPFTNAGREEYWRMHRHAYEGMARAAIEAMRVPTTSMLDEACEVGPDTNSGQFGYEDAILVYTTMIDAALTDGGG